MLSSCYEYTTNRAVMGAGLNPDTWGPKWDGKHGCGRGLGVRGGCLPTEDVRWAWLSLWDTPWGARSPQVGSGAFGHGDFEGDLPMHIPESILALGCHWSSGPSPHGMLPLKFLTSDLLPSLSCCRFQRHSREFKGAGEAGSWRKPAGNGCLEWAR